MSTTPEQSPTDERSRTIHYQVPGKDRRALFARSGLEQLRAVHSTLPAGVGYASLELKVSFLRPITAETGAVTARGWVTRAGRSSAFAEADIRDADGRILATASSTCLIVRPEPAA